MDKAIKNHKLSDGSTAYNLVVYDSPGLIKIIFSCINEIAAIALDRCLEETTIDFSEGGMR